ncbi:unnamed protein product [Polarella glacialis]|uniref:Uncharacterized protein n=1 Tax=Polarella glacialis TaxID=89957 RepID=A0A813IG62_POLGL|nr:unnamed protein product [Polarella glacialis]
MLGKFMASFGNKILKHSEEGKTLLMGAAENGPQIISYSDPESPYICRSDLTAFDVILHWTHMYGAPPDQTTDDGYSAAMLAELAGNDQNTVKRLLLASFSLDPSSDNLIYRMAFSPITTGLMICVSFVSLATLAVVLRSRPSSNVAVVLHSRPSSKVINFILRAMALFICNHVMLYGQDVAWIFWKDKDHMSWQSLQHGLSILGQPWNFTLGCWFVPIAVMAVLSMCFMVHDLCQASNAIENCSGKDADEDVEPSDIYQNPECPIVDCLHRFLLAAVFMVVYVTKVLTPLETTLQSRTFWGLSLFVQMHLHWPQPCCEPKDFVSVLRWLCCADGPLNPSLWSLFLSGSYKKADAKESDPMGRPEVVTRFILSYLSNALFKVILLYTLPIYLAATTDPGDFALNAFAVTFIIDLDNEDKAKKYGHVSKRETGNSEQESTAGEPLLQVPAEPCV